MQFTERLPPTSLRVELHSAPAANHKIRERTDAEIIRLEQAPASEFQARLRELDLEPDVEQILQTNASIIVLLGLYFGAKFDKRFLLLPAAVFSFFGQHAIQGWCPPIPLFRRLGFRTQREIERERYAIKALRGDFDEVSDKRDLPAAERIRAVLAAVDK